MPESLQNKIVALTGGTTGIGFDSAQQLVEAGAEVYIFGRQSPRLDAAVEKLGARAHATVVDFSDHRDIDRKRPATTPVL